MFVLVKEYKFLSELGNFIIVFLLSHNEKRRHSLF